MSQSRIPVLSRTIKKSDPDGEVSLNSKSKKAPVLRPPILSNAKKLCAKVNEKNIVPIYPVKNKPLSVKQTVVKSFTYKTCKQHECPQIKTINKAAKCAERTKIVLNHVKAKENVLPLKHQIGSSQEGIHSKNARNSRFAPKLRKDASKNAKSVKSVNLNSKLNRKKDVFSKESRKCVKRGENVETLNQLVDVKKSQIDNQREKISVIRAESCETIAKKEENGPGLEECENGKKLAGESQPPYISLQKDINFEADDYYRKLILSGRELTPSVMSSGAKLSFWEHKPSFYQTVEETMKALEKLHLTNPKRSLTNRGSFLRMKRVSTTPCLKNSRLVECDPFKQALQKLDALRTKNSKKVTFNLRTTVIPDKTDSFSCKESSAEQLPESSESRLTDICGKAEASGSNSGNKLPLFLSPSTPSHWGGEPGDGAVSGKETNVACNLPSSCELERNEGAREFGIASRENRQCTERLPLEKTHCSDNNVPNSKRNTLYLTSANRTCSNTETIFTPHPFSLYSQSKQAHSGSPEFLEVKPRKVLPDHPPIYTPLVLRSLAKQAESSEKSPTTVRLKLDFDAVEMELLKSCDNQGSVASLKRSAQLTPAFKRIATAQKLLDHLADQECSVLLLSQTFPVLCGRYIKNPIALVLEEGDEMHFLPIGSPDL